MSQPGAAAAAETAQQGNEDEGQEAVVLELLLLAGRQGGVGEDPPGDPGLRARAVHHSHQVLVVDRQTAVVVLVVVAVVPVTYRVVESQLEKVQLDEDF